MIDQCYYCPIEERYAVEVGYDGYPTGFGDYHGCCVGCWCDAITDTVESIAKVRQTNYWFVTQWMRWDQ